MAIAQTGAIYKALNFDGQSSRNYGVYITGEAVYNAPERAVEMISIPGRNGAFAMDLGRFENITISYPAGIFADTEADFADAISDFRNYLCSRSGYCRLTDDYNPDEYRMAVYKSGLEVDPALLRAGEFNIVFECKPQRYLTSGEATQTIANSGDTITNPTLFESRPMIETFGYGTLTVNGHEIELENDTLGNVDLLGAPLRASTKERVSSLSKTWKFNKELVANGDTLTLNNLSYTHYGTEYWGSLYSSGCVTLDRDYTPYYAAITQTVSANLVFGTGKGALVYANAVGCSGLLNSVVFNVGTASSETGTITFNVPTKDANDTVVETATFTHTLTVDYDGVDEISILITTSIDSDSLGLWFVGGNDYYRDTLYGSLSNVIGDSNVSILGTPTYIDCDLGICYKIENDTIIDLNRYIDLGSNMPELSPGSNTITFDNTYTQVDIVPRWWKV